MLREKTDNSLTATVIKTATDWVQQLHQMFFLSVAVKSCCGSKENNRYNKSNSEYKNKRFRGIRVYRTRLIRLIHMMYAHVRVHAYAPARIGGKVYERIDN